MTERELEKRMKSLSKKENIDFKKLKEELADTFSKTDIAAILTQKSSILTELNQVSELLLQIQNNNQKRQ